MTSFGSAVSHRRSHGHCFCDSVPHSSWDSNCVVRQLLRNAGRTLPLHFVVQAAVHGRLGLPGWRLSGRVYIRSSLPLSPLVPVPNRPTRLRYSYFSEPVWPSGKAVRLVSGRTSVRIRFGSPFSSKVVVCGHCLVTLFLTFNEVLKWFSSLPMLMQESFWW